MRRSRTIPVAAAVAALLATTTACAGSGSGSDSGSTGPVTIGTSLSLTGSLGAFGVLQRKGYQQAVDDVNGAGGLEVGSGRRKVVLKVLDNRSDPKLASSQARQLILKDDATALLGPCTPPIVVPVAQVAESQRVPMVTSCAPTGAFTAGNASGWKYSWDLFFSEKDQAAGAAKAVGEVTSNKKVALFTDTEPDGVVERPIYKAAAEAAGLQVVGDYTFPPGTSDFSSFVNDAKAKGAQVVLAQMVPPDGIALWKQMKALGFAPQAAFVSKAGVTSAWSQALGPVAEGSLSESFWAPGIGDATMEAHIADTLGTSVAAPDLPFAVFSLTSAQVLLDGITSAGSTQAAAVNSAIGKTDKTYALGEVSFDDHHVAVTPYVVVQWQGGTTVSIVPQGSAALQAPPTGLS